MAFLCIPYTQCHGKRLASYDDVMSEVGAGGIKVNWVDPIKKKSKSKF